MPGGGLFAEVVQREGCFQVVMDEPPIEVGEAEERSWTFRGSGQSWIMDTLVGSICSPLGDRMNPRYSTVSMWNLHFLRLAYSPTMCKRCKTSQTWSQWSSRESEYIRISSR